MKQFGIIFICVGMMLAVSCSKDQLDGDLSSLPTQVETEDYKTPYGTFEGEWQLSKYGKTCPGEIEVRTDEIIFNLPADYLVPRLGFVSEKTKADHPDEPFYTTTSDYTYFDTSQTMRYSMLGYSTEALYIKNENVDQGGISVGVRADDVDYSLNLIGIKEQPSAVFDISSGLWKLAIPIDKATIYNRKTGVQMSISMLDVNAPEKSAWLFVFRAKKRTE